VGREVKEAYHLGVILGFDNGRIATMILRCTCIKNAHLPPKPPSHLNLERWKLEVTPVSVYAQSLSNAHYQSGQGPDLARIVISSKKDEEDDEGLEDEDFVAIQEVGSCKGLLQTKAIPVQKGCAIFSPSLTALLGGCACDRAVIDSK
jgi:hypothetical protein